MILNTINEIDCGPDVEYDCSKYDKSKGFTKLMRYVMLINKYPKLFTDISMMIESEPELLDKQNEKGWTALMLACHNSRVFSSEKIVEVLINTGADLNLKNNEGFTALMFACGE